MNLFLGSVFLGIVPMVIYALIVWRIDRWEKEPFGLIVVAFVWGFIPSALFAIIAQEILGLPVDLAGEVTLGGELYKASILAPLTEELVKGFGVWLLMIIFHKQIDSVLDGMIYGSMVGFGFSAIENILYFSGQPDAASLLALFFLRAFVFGLLHAMFTGLTGIGLAMGKFSRSLLLKLFWPVCGLALAMLTHALHNYFATIGGESILYAVVGSTLGIAFFVTIVAVCLFHENRWIRIHLSDEVERGVLFAQQAEDAAALWKRSSLSMLTEGLGNYWNRRCLLHHATRLAYKKQQILKTGDSPGIQKAIEELRAKVLDLSRKDPLVIAGRIDTGRTLPPPLPPKRQIPPPLPPRQS